MNAKKNTLTLVIFFIYIITVHAKTPQDTTASKNNDTGTAASTKQPIVDTVGSTKKTPPETTASDNTESIAGIDKIVDSSSLYNAQHYPEKYLYRNYLFDKNYADDIKWFHAIASTILLLLLWLGGIRYAVKDGLCKDACFNQDGSQIDPIKCPFSYARTQLLWWTMIILSCYIFFYGITGVVLPLNITAALLLGFGAVVYGFGKVIDNRQIQESKGWRNQDLGAQKTKPDFIKDILSDDNGVSIHRFQAVLFNLIFGIGFIGGFVKAIISQKYPFIDFNEWQFALLGISSATYLGLKASENNPKNIKEESSETDMGEKNEVEADGSVG
jgi:hypothetical protein